MFRKSIAFVVAVLFASSLFAQCPGGSCPPSGRSVQQPHTQQRPKQKPENQGNITRPVGVYASAVRINCRINAKEGCKGSGVLVRWGGRILVVTARHVIADAKAITVRLSTGATLKATVIASSPWDCAILQLEGDADGVTPAELVNNAEAQFKQGESLRSCGFGGEDLFAVNSGTFLGYKRSSEAIDAYDDWMEITGPSRQGDSGGPIYNKDGKVAGILWGTDGDMTIGVQAGRLGVLLNKAISDYRE